MFQLVVWCNLEFIEMLRIFTIFFVFTLIDIIDMMSSFYDHVWILTFNNLVFRNWSCRRSYSSSTFIKIVLSINFYACKWQLLLLWSLNYFYVISCKLIAMESLLIIIFWWYFSNNSIGNIFVSNHNLCTHTFLC